MNSSLWTSRMGGWMRWGVLSLVGAGLFGAIGVQAQETNATCTTDSWAFNSQGNSPCIVASEMASVCNGGQYFVLALPTGSHYTGPDPQQANACQCSSVLYNLLSACGDCQERTIVSWNGWNTACDNPLIGWNQSIPVNTSVPHWAYINPETTNGQFDPVQAQAAGDSPEVSRTSEQVTQTVGSPDSSATNSISTTPAPTNSPNNQQSSKKSNNAGAIAGGVVGGVVGAALLGVLGFWYWRKKRDTERWLKPDTVRHVGENDPMMHSPFGPTSIASPVFSNETNAPRLYDPNDPSTFPTSPLPETIDSSYSGPQYSGHTTNTGYAPNISLNTGRAAGYTGAPEV